MDDVLDTIVVKNTLRHRESVLRPIVSSCQSISRAAISEVYLPEVCYSLSHHPPIHVQLGTVGLERLIEGERHGHIKFLRYVEVKCGDEKSHSGSSAGKTFRKLSRFP